MPVDLCSDFVSVNMVAIRLGSRRPAGEVNLLLGLRCKNAAGDGHQDITLTRMHHTCCPRCFLLRTRSDVDGIKRINTKCVTNNTAMPRSQWLPGVQPGQLGQAGIGI